MYTYLIIREHILYGCDKRGPKHEAKYYIIL